MSRAERLLDLLQILRRHRRAVSGATLSSELGISLRTLYRDIATLQGQGATIEGEAGLGYVLRPGFTLPPLMFLEEEIEALVLGSRWVADRGDERLAFAARNALAKISAVLPAELRVRADTSALLVGPATTRNKTLIDLGLVREAIRDERKLEILYSDRQSAQTHRTIWPFALAFFEQVRLVVGWCESRRDFRHFRTDRIAQLSMSKERYPRRRHTLLKEWQSQEGIEP